MLAVFGWMVFGKLVPLRVQHPDQAVVEIALVVCVHCAHGIGAVQVGVGGDHLQIGRVLQHDLVKQGQREAGKLYVPAGRILDLHTLRFGNRAAPASGNPGHRMDRLAPQKGDDLVVALAAGDHLAGHIQPDLAGHPQNVALRGGRIRPDDEVRSAQSIKVGGVIGDEKGHVEQLAQFFGHGGGLGAEDTVQRLCGGQVVGLRADPADPVGDDRHLLGHPAHAELLKAAQLRDLEAGVLHRSLIVEKDIYPAMPFQAGDRVDRDPCRHQ